MPRTLHLEDFAPVAPTALARETTEGLTETQRLSAFEQGYKAGWDDAIVAADEDQSRITTDLAARLQDLSFSFHEARAHVLAGVEALVTSVMRTLAPRIGADVLPHLVLDHLQDLMQASADTPICMRVSPSDRAAIQAMLPQDPGFPILIEESADFASGQVTFVMGQSESELDLGECFAQIEQKIDIFFSDNERQLANG